jgi:site-specific recombinase XerD
MRPIFLPFSICSFPVVPRSSAVLRHHIHEKPAPLALQQAVRNAGIVKHASVHALWGSFATQPFMNGVHILELQERLAHKTRRLP